MNKIPADVFLACGRALFGEEFTSPMARTLGVDRNTVGRWASGKTPIPPSVWSELATFVRNRRAIDLDALEREVIELSLGARKSRRVVDRNVHDGLIRLSRPFSEHDVHALRRSLNAFTDQHGLSAGWVAAHGDVLAVNIPASLDGPMRKPFELWFNGECDRIDAEDCRRAPYTEEPCG